MLMPPHLHSNPKCVLLRCYYCIDGDLTARPCWHYEDPTMLLLERQVTAFVFRMLKVCAVIWSSIYNGIPQHPYWWCQCVTVVMLEIVLCAPQHSAFFLDTLGLPWEQHYHGIKYVCMHVLLIFIFWACIPNAVGSTLSISIHAHVWQRHGLYTKIPKPVRQLLTVCKVFRADWDENKSALAIFPSIRTEINFL